jgi:hypothetical protein
MGAYPTRITTVSQEHGLTSQEHHISKKQGIFPTLFFRGILFGTTVRHFQFIMMRGVNIFFRGGRYEDHSYAFCWGLLTPGSAKEADTLLEDRLVEPTASRRTKQH